MCIQDCRTFFWRGAGYAAHDAGGNCFCVCEDDGWSDINILGRASCVPVIAHQVFGWLGLILSTAALFHVVYHLLRQVSQSTRHPHNIVQWILKGFQQHTHDVTRCGGHIPEHGTHT